MSQKRQASTSAPRKRRKTTGRPFGGGSDEVPTPQSQANQPSSSGWSTRTVGTSGVPSLSALCIRAFVDNLPRFSAKPELWDAVKPWLTLLPDNLIPRVFTTARNAYPSLLTHPVISTYFLRGPSITLSGNLGVTRFTLSALAAAESKQYLRQLELSDLTKIPDEVFANVVSHLPSVEVLILRGCSKVGQKTVSAVAKHCPKLTKLNLNYTSVIPVSLAPVLQNCKALGVLKMAGISSWTDTTVSKLWSVLGADSDDSKFVVPNIYSLNIRQTPITDSVVDEILTICPNIRRLDLSFTNIKHPPLLLSHKGFEKLSLTSTRIPSTHLVNILSDLPNLKSLSLGAQGGGQGSSASVTNSTAMTLNDQTLRQLTDILENYSTLENISLVGNTKLGFSSKRSDSALADFIRKVGRRCISLNMANITNLSSPHLEGLLAEDEQGPPRLRTLILNNTSVGDDAAPYISACSELNTLELAGTKFSSVGLFPIIDACTKLEQLNLTSCRGVPVGDRRRFFEVWEEEWKNR
ncbi:RNI-like protein [Panus rudis PR-1116 ss-1]|nr:RNI-like protein [Panus rudis PR-1116 ss-1]